MFYIPYRSQRSDSEEMDRAPDYLIEKATRKNPLKQAYTIYARSQGRRYESIPSNLQIR